MAKCPTCKGSGEFDHLCTACSGTGEIITIDKDGNEISITCPLCGGTGTDPTCLTCGGNGEVQSLTRANGCSSLTTAATCM